MRQLYLVAALALASACSANDDVPSPTIGSLFPDHGAPGDSVTIMGSGLCQQPAPEEGEDVDPLRCDHIGDVVFDNSPATLTQYLDMSIGVTVPDLEAGPATVIVRVAGRSTRGAAFVVE